MDSHTDNVSPGQSMTFFGHLDALRPHLLRSALAVVLLMILAFFCKSLIIDQILMGPQLESFPTNRLLTRIAEFTGIQALRFTDTRIGMINTSMAGQLNLHLQVSFITALVLACPYILWELWRFVKPALTVSELSSCRRLIFYISVCFFTGLGFGYFIISPLTVNFLSHYTASSEIVNMIDIRSYISSVINVAVACAVLFQLPLVIHLLSRMGILKASLMRRYRRHTLVILMVFAAIITPPDVFSLLLVGLPLFGLYEYGIRIAAANERKSSRKENQEADT